ncbi:MAG: hypothetical protein V1720_14050 [bacterium]
MRYLSFVIFIYISSVIFAQSPHGDDFDLDCENCHNADTWAVNIQNIQFEHQTTGFTLTGQHNLINCKSCHVNLQFKKVKKQCFECHTDVHEETVGTECANCHQPSSWIVTNITEIHQMGRFPLVGAHATADCRQCHTGVSKVNFAPLGIECVDCHRMDYSNAKSPNHIAGNFSTDCQECHSLTSDQWSATSFSHTFFPLSGGHQISNCFECHSQNTFSGLTQECSVCHINNYNATVNPPHQSLQFPTECNQCHTTTPGWQPANFAIHDQYYPLIGAHAAISNNCSTCHTTGYTNTPNECYGCHSSDYNGTANPPHASSGFSTNCEECHSPNAWSPATFDHDGQFFPIYSGKHAGAWDNCSDCHTNTSNFSMFSCIDCHEHNKQDMDEEHNGINGYSYNNDACYSCHPTGRKDDGFNHANTGFPLTGSHISLDCQQCHASGYANTSPECYSCHQDNYNSAPNHQSQGYPQTCEQCHTTTAWSETSFNHSATNFPLTGAHTSADCNQCHTNGFTGTTTICSDCHTSDFQGSVNPNHVQLNFPTDCETCHTTQPGWQPAQFTIHDNYYLLTGAHAGIASECATCHNGDYTNTPDECYGCHQSNYEQTTNPNHISVGIDTDCELCHTTTPDWKPALFPIHNDIYPLLGAHAAIATDCAACHNGNYSNTLQECYGCHAQDYNNTSNPSHTATGFGTNCEDCHTSGGWVPATFDHDAQYFPIYTGKHNNEWNACADCHVNAQNYSVFECVNCHEHSKQDMDEEHQGVNGYIYASAECYACHPDGSKEGAFNHANSDFPLTGAHSTLDCQQCHQSGYLGTSAECVSCHQDNFDATQNPNHIAIGLNAVCQNCHNTTAWTPSTFVHASTGYELLGQHAAVQCSSCHQGNTSGTSSECYPCHQENYNSAPEHISKKYPTNCELCHSPAGWNQTSFDHANTAFPLTGAHVNSNCDQCHAAGYSGTSMECFACHNENFNGAQNPNHTAAGLPHACEQCHTTAAWTPSTFNHSSTGFELIGQHITTLCSACHQGTTANTPNQCVGCHQNNYNNAPNHQTQNYPTDCAMCHNPNSWNQTSFNHSSTNFPLTGSHINVNCNLCHTAGYTGTPSQCFACHGDNYNTAPNHQSQGYPTDCVMCHNTNLWSEVTFNHSSTNFPLTGSHTNVSCNTCHSSGFTGTPTQCFSCHGDNYAAAPNHQSQGYPTDCSMCHTTTGWSPSSFNHSNTDFPLTGVHINTSCNQCHSGGFTGTPTACNACHNDDYANAPNHQSQGYPTDCSICHTTTGWIPSSFNHSNTDFPLTGAHINTSCSQCHASGFTGTPTACNACHNDDYNSSVNPNHSSLSLPTTCEQCHTTNTGWAPATFPIHNNYYPLIGAHASIANNCATCHNGNYTNTPNTCYGCHQSDYNSTNNPDHAAAGFPTDCESCHTQNAWDPSTFDHDGQYFPIYSGQHNNEWNLCSDCHPNASNFQIFTCLTCHTQSSTNNDHQGVSGYSYNSDACYDCHPNGEDDRGIILPKHKFDVK